MPNVHMAAATLADGQLNDSEVTAQYQTDEGVTDATMQLGALNRIAESNLAIAYEQRTSNLIALLQLANVEGWAQSADAEIARTMVIEALDIASLTEIIDGVKRGRTKQAHPDQIGDRRKLIGTIMNNWDELISLPKKDAKDVINQLARNP